MRTRAAALALTLAAAPTAALAQTADRPSEAPTRYGWQPSSRVSFGSRLVARHGDYDLAGFGGQLAVRAFPWASVELFTDHMVGTREGALRHDHEVGATLRLHLLRGERWSVFPMVGACANLAVLHAADAPDATATDVQFGLRAGAGVEYALPRGFAVGADVLALAYLGHALQGWRWRAETSSELSVTPMAQVVLHASYHL